MKRYDSIPSELRELNQWVCTKEDSKVPMKAFQRAAASSTDPSTWSSFDAAVNAVSSGRYDYCGFVFADNGIVGIDIDTGFDEDGFLSSVAYKIIGKCRSYTEKSKSGRGFHILVKGDIPFKGRNNLAGVEVYKSARYFIMTGNAICFHEIIENQEAIDFVISTYFQESIREENESTYTPKLYTPVWTKPTGGKIKLRPEYPAISHGSRNLSLTSIAGAMHSQGYTKKQIFDELIHVNEVACKPPLKKSEIRSVCNSVTKYKK